MIEYSCAIPPDLGDRIEEVLSEIDSLYWSVHSDHAEGTILLKGYFRKQSEGAAAWTELRASCPELPETPDIHTVDERDWREAYKEFFEPWSLPGLHWVPEWMRATHPVPHGEAVLYLDPGMAFGTGNHETTRLFARRLLKARAHWGDAIREKTVIDAGCGSGILALSAAALGFGTVQAFDNDPEAVRIAQDNTAANRLDSIHVSCTDLTGGLSPGSADLLLANILANVLEDHAETLLRALRPGGVLVLSGILREEAAATSAAFAETAARLGIPWQPDSRSEGEWADLCHGGPFHPQETPTP